MFGTGTGTFGHPLFFETNPSIPTWITAQDLNGDGHLDLAVDTNDLLGTISLYFGDGKGHFSSASQIALYGSPFAIGDINGDGLPDIVTSFGQVAYGKGNGKFSTAVYYPVETSSQESVVLADLRGNGKLDIVAGENLAVSVLLNSGGQRFTDGVCAFRVTRRF